MANTKTKFLITSSTSAVHIRNIKVIFFLFSLFLEIYYVMTWTLEWELDTENELLILLPKMSSFSDDLLIFSTLSLALLQQMNIEEDSGSLGLFLFLEISNFVLFTLLVSHVCLFVCSDPLKLFFFFFDYENFFSAICFGYVHVFLVLLINDFYLTEFLFAGYYCRKLFDGWMEVVDTSYENS